MDSEKASYLCNLMEFIYRSVLKNEQSYSETNRKSLPLYGPLLSRQFNFREVAWWQRRKVDSLFSASGKGKYKDEGQRPLEGPAGQRGRAF